MKLTRRHLQQALALALDDLAELDRLRDSTPEVQP